MRERVPSSPTPPLQIASCLLLVSGFAALIYQTVWMTSFRLIFGASTPATGAVLAIFMGGLGLGGWFWGRRLEGNPKPLKIYGQLEMIIAAVAAASPGLIELVKDAYVGFGGAAFFGVTGGLIVRLLLAAAVIGIPVFCMGGTLPAMARYVTDRQDDNRKGLAVIYGVNTLGSVLGALAGTFFLFETVGIRNTLWLAALLNGVIAVTAWRIASWQGSELQSSSLDSNSRGADEDSIPALPRSITLVGAFTAGFIFFVAEMVWFRMAAPILGGTTYSFGLVLSIALVGIGAGSLAYRRFSPKAINSSLLVVTFMMEGFFLLLPLLVGDRLALWALSLRAAEGLSFAQLCMGWSLVTSFLVLPTSFVAGFQFPVLVALCGKGAKGVSNDVGTLYLSNTCGAVLGSLAGGFGLMPLLGALGVWKLCVLLSGVMAVLVYGFGPKSRRLLWGFVVPLGVLMSLANQVALGPTAVWRHSGIGAGRTSLRTDNANEIERSMNRIRRQISLELEGVESPLGVSKEGYALLNSGKSDGNAWSDVMTMVLTGLIGAAIHPNPQEAFVVGLGSGQTAGWLAEVPTVKKVDVAELEPKVGEFAEMVADSNFNVTKHPKINCIYDDGRTSLLASKHQYDLIVSQPSNPYRAGVSSFFTDDFYAGVTPRLKKQGLFLQWLQGYEIDDDTLTLILSTLYNNFKYVSVWSMKPLDYLLVASNEPQVVDVASLKQRLKLEPYKTAFEKISGSYGVEGFLALHEGNPLFVHEVTAPPNDLINTDDRNLVEYQFAKTLGQADSILPKDLYIYAERLRAHRPKVVGAVDWKRVSMLKNRTNQFLNVMLPFSYYNDWWALTKQKAYVKAVEKIRASAPVPAYDVYGKLALFEFALYRGQQFSALPAEDPAHHPDFDPWLDPKRQPEFLAWLERTGHAEEAAWFRLVRAVTQNNEQEAIQAASQAFAVLRKTPWLRKNAVSRLLDELGEKVWSKPTSARLAADLAQAPFALNAHEAQRVNLAQRLAEAGEDWPLCAKLYEANEHAPQWEKHHLERRLRCYEKEGHPLMERAATDLKKFGAQEGI